MYIKIGDIQIGGESPYQLEPGISGLGAGDIRTGDGVYSGVHGGYVSSQLYGYRTITFTGFYLTDCDTLDSLRIELLDGLKIGYLHPIFIKSFGDDFYFTEGYVTDIQADVEGSKSGEFQVSILCPDPYIYLGGDGSDPESVWQTENAVFTESSVSLTIDNEGLVTTFPVFTLSGVANPSVRNETTGEHMTVSGDYLGQDLIIDMKNHLITRVNDNTPTSVANNREITSSWWGLAPGENAIYFSIENTPSQVEISSLSVKYKVGYRGI